MATLYTVLSSIQSQISSVTQGLISNSPDTFGQPLTVRVGLYWPSQKSLQDNVRKGNGGSGPTALVTIYDRGMARDSTRWLPAIIQKTSNQATMGVTLSEPKLQQLQTMTITFTDPVGVGDAVGLVLTRMPGQAVTAFVPAAVLGDTAATMAAKLAAMMQADPTFSAWGTASASGPVVTLTSLLAGNFVLISANVGNGGSNLVEVGRRSRHFQIVVWARTPDDRITVCDPIEALIAETEYNFGLTFPDGTMGRLTFYSDQQHDEATFSDTMRRDFMVCVDYGINVTDVTYSVLAPVAQYSVF